MAAVQASRLRCPVLVVLICQCRSHSVGKHNRQAIFMGSSHVSDANSLVTQHEYDGTLKQSHTAARTLRSSAPEHS